MGMIAAVMDNKSAILVACFDLLVVKGTGMGDLHLDFPSAISQLVQTIILYPF